MLLKSKCLKSFKGSEKNALMRLWLELEEFINDDTVVREKVENYLLGIYLYVRKKLNPSSQDDISNDYQAFQGNSFAS